MTDIAIDHIDLPAETELAPPPAGPFPTLTAREREVAHRLSVGRRNSEIAAELDISVKTVDTHRAHVLKKLLVRNNVELARLAIRNGWVEL